MAFWFSAPTAQPAAGPGSAAAGSAHAPPAYNVILLDGGDTVVHHHEFLDASRLAGGQARYTKAP